MASKPSSVGEAARSTGNRSYLRFKALIRSIWAMAEVDEYSTKKPIFLRSWGNKVWIPWTISYSKPSMDWLMIWSGLANLFPFSKRTPVFKAPFEITSPGNTSCCTCLPFSLCTKFVGGMPSESSCRVKAARASSVGYSSYTSMSCTSMFAELTDLISASRSSVSFFRRLKPPGKSSPPK